MRLTINQLWYAFHFPVCASISKDLRCVFNNNPKVVLYKHFSCEISVSSNKMDIKTFVFMDSETTGLPFQENNRTRMTELCFTAVQSDHISLGVFPRIQSKVSLCFNPRKFINPDATKVTGLSNDLLEYQPEFDSTAFGVIQSFLNIHRKPICFVAHNGDRFDYPILRAEVHKTGNKLPEDILCVDSLTAFRELYYQDLENAKENVCVAQEKEEVPVEFQDGFDELLCTIVDELEQPGCSTPKKLTMAEIQAKNETTPQKQTIISNGVCLAKFEVNGDNSTNLIAPSSKRKLHWEARPSFKLGDVYKRLTSKEPTNAHQAEQDVNMMIECAATLGQRFVDWSNLHTKKFCDTPMMIPGKKFGT